MYQTLFQEDGEAVRVWNFPRDGWAAIGLIFHSLFPSPVWGWEGS